MYGSPTEHDNGNGGDGYQIVRQFIKGADHGGGLAIGDEGTQEINKNAAALRIEDST